MLTAVLIFMSVILVVMAIAAVFFDKIIDKKKTKEGRIVRILLYEAIGDQKIYRGEHLGYEENDEALGVYFHIKKLKKVISTVRPEDYFGDAKYGRCLLICKFADDDFRPISRLQDQHWLRKIPLSPEKYLKTKMVTINDKEVHEVVLDKEGNPIPLLDKKGNPLPDYTLEKYEEPIGVDQTHREVQRFNRVWSKRMQEKRAKNPGFLEKFAPYITTVVVVFIMFIAFAYMTNKNNDFLAEVSAETLKGFDTTANKYIEATNNPSFAENMYEKLEQREREEEAPPR